VFYRNILGLDSGFTAAQLKTAYRECAAQYHPDRFTTAPEKDRRRAEEMMKQINAAYQALGGA
jgi:curved DNA-binding protein CbpA